MSETQGINNVVSIARNRRTDAMFVAAYLAVGTLVYLVVYQTQVGEFAQGVLTVVLTMFLKELQNMYSFETGTTRGEVAKAETIKTLAEKTIDASEQRQTIAQTVVQDIAKTVPIAAAISAASVNGNGPVKVETVNVEAESATVLTGELKP